MDDEHGPLETSHSNFLLSIVGAVGSMLLFAFIIFIAYVPNRPAPVNEDIVQQRKDNLAEVQAAQAQAASNYAWVNQKEGIARIPIAQAMQVASQRLGEGEAAFTIVKTPAPAAEPEPEKTDEADKKDESLPEKSVEAIEAEGAGT